MSSRLTSLMRAVEAREGRPLQDVVRQALADTQSVEAAARRLGVTDKTFRDWVHRLGLRLRLSLQPVEGPFCSELAMERFRRRFPEGTAWWGERIPNGDFVLRASPNGERLCTFPSDQVPAAVLAAHAPALLFHCIQLTAVLEGSPASAPPDELIRYTGMMTIMALDHGEDLANG